MIDLDKEQTRAKLPKGTSSVKCIQCSKYFEVNNAEINRSGGKYCSRDCWRASRKILHATQYCLHCSKLIVQKKFKIQKFCSLSCSITSRNYATKQNPVDIFWGNVDKSADCWIYTRCISSTGYGRILVDGKFIAAHRFSYELHFHPIPDDIFVCHACDNPPCVNPQHLFLGTAYDNNIDKTLKNRQPKGESHGMHVLTESQAIEIKKLLKQNISAYEIKELFNVHEQTIYAIKYGKNWKWLQA